MILYFSKQTIMYLSHVMHAPTHKSLDELMDLTSVNTLQLQGKVMRQFKNCVIIIQKQAPMSSQRLDVQPVQPPEVPEYSAGSGPGLDMARTRFRPCSACSGVQHVFSVYRGVQSVQSVQPVWASGSGCSGDGPEGIQARNRNDL